MILTIETTTSPPCSKGTPETENDTPPQAQPIKPLSFSNGGCSLRKLPHHRYGLPPTAVVSYKNCLKNHAASLGGHALDGCGEFMPSSTANPTDPTSLKCAACGCHRNFHRREADDYSSPSAPAPQFLDFHHQPPPPRRPHTPSPSLSPSPSPPPPQRNLNPSYAPQMLLALSTAAADENPPNPIHPVLTPFTPVAFKTENLSGRKRFRTKFSPVQKEKMYAFSEKLGWKMQKCDENLVEEFCNEVGVAKNVLKVWMHNNKSTFGKKDTNTTNNINPTTAAAAVIPINNNSNTNGNGTVHHYDSNSHYNNTNNNNDHHGIENGIGIGLHLQVSANGSTSSS